MYTVSGALKFVQERVQNRSVAFSNELEIYTNDAIAP